MKWVITGLTDKKYCKKKERYSKKKLLSLIQKTKKLYKINEF